MQSGFESRASCPQLNATGCPAENDRCPPKGVKPMGDSNKTSRALDATIKSVLIMQLTLFAASVAAFASVVAVWDQVMATAASFSDRVMATAASVWDLLP